MLYYLRLMLQLIMAPSHGWEDVAECSRSARYIFAAGLVPISVAAALCVYFSAIYDHHPSGWLMTLHAVVTFAELFLTYFVGMLVMLSCLPHITTTHKANEERVGLFLSLAIGMMATISIIRSVLPAKIPLFEFLPIFVLVVMCRGREFLDVAEESMFKFMALNIVAAILPIYLIDWLFSAII